jgi:hypothetical protein
LRRFDRASASILPTPPAGTVRPTARADVVRVGVDVVGQRPLVAAQHVVQDVAVALAGDTAWTRAGEVVDGVDVCACEAYTWGRAGAPVENVGPSTTRGFP